MDRHMDGWMDRYSWVLFIWVEQDSDEGACGTAVSLCRPTMVSVIAATHSINTPTSSYHYDISEGETCSYTPQGDRFHLISTQSVINSKNIDIDKCKIIYKYYFLSDSI